MKENRFLVLMFGFLAVLCFSFGFLLPFNNLVAKADSVDVNYTFTSSDTYMITSQLNATQQVPLLFSGNHTYTSGSFKTNLNCYYAYAGNGHSSVDYYSLNYIQMYVDGSNSFVTGNSSTFFELSYNTRYVFYLKPQSSDVATCNIRVYVEDGFNANVSYVSLSKSHTSIACPNGLSGKDLVNVVYTDVNEKSITFSVAVATNLTFNSRTYYLSQDLSDNQIYNQGYNQGLIDNQQNIYNEGYSAGSIDGYGSGYTAGQNDSNVYSFSNLFGAVLDAPVQTLIGLLNFNLLGVNLFALFAGILTIIVFAFIIKTFKGGR